MLSPMADLREVIEVDGVHCVQCVQKIGVALADTPGLVAAGVNLVGQVTLVLESDDDAVRSEVRRRLVAAGFPPAAREA